MKALVFEKVGEAREVLAVREVHEPQAGPGQVLIAVEASPVHPADFGFVRGAYRVKPSLPQIAGLSGAGRVLSVGTGVPAALARGTRVAFRWPGAWAERVAVPVERVFAVPEDIAAEPASQFPVNPITAWGLLDVARAKRGEWIGLTAASSSVAALVSALALEQGLQVIGIARTQSLAELASKVHGIADSEPELAQRVRAVTSEHGLSALIDCVGGPLLGSLFPALAPGATVVAYGTLSPEPVPVRNATLVYGNLTWQGFGIDRYSAGLTPEQLVRMSDSLWEGIRHNRLALPIRGRFALGDLSAGLQAAVAGGPGKVVFTPAAP